MPAQPPELARGNAVTERTKFRPSAAERPKPRLRVSVAKAEQRELVILMENRTSLVGSDSRGAAGQRWADDRVVAELVRQWRRKGQLRVDDIRRILPLDDLAPGELATLVVKLCEAGIDVAIDREYLTRTWNTGATSVEPARDSVEPARDNIGRAPTAAHEIAVHAKRPDQAAQETASTAVVIALAAVFGLAVVASVAGFW